MFTNFLIKFKIKILPDILNECEIELDDLVTEETVGYT